MTNGLGVCCLVKLIIFFLFESHQTQPSKSPDPVRTPLKIHLYLNSLSICIRKKLLTIYLISISNDNAFVIIIHGIQLPPFSTGRGLKNTK